MTDEIFFDGVRYVLAGDAAVSSNLTRDYIARLAREGKIVGKQVGRQWYVSQESLKTFLVGQESSNAQRRNALTRERQQEYGRIQATAPEQKKSLEAAVVVPTAALIPDVPESAKELHRKITDAVSRTSAEAISHATNLVGKTSAQVPLYVVSPGIELLHKVATAVLAVALVVGMYTAGNDFIQTSPQLITGTTALTPSSALSASAATIGDTFSGIADAIGNGFNTLLSPLFGGYFASNGSSTGVVDVQIAQRMPSVATAAPVTNVKVQTQSPAKVTSTYAPSTTIIENPVTERVVETDRVVTQGGVTQDDLDQAIQELDNALLQKIYSLTDANSTVTAQNYQVTAQTNAIDQLNGTTINNATINGGSIANASFNGGSINGSTISGATFTGTTTLDGLEVTSPYPASFASGIDIQSGCFSVDGTCIGGGAGNPGGSNTQVQFNDNGVAFNGSPTFTFNKTTGTLSILNASSTYATSTYFAVTNIASTSNLVVSQGFTFGSASGILKAVAGVVSSGLVNLGSDVASVLPIGNGGTGTTSAPSYGEVLVGNSSGSYDLVSTSSLGISGGGGGTWGSITGTLSNQTDLQNALNAKFSLSDWYATTTNGLAEGSNNLYYTNARVQSYLDTLNKGYFFATTSALYFLAQNQGNAFSTTSVAFYLSQQNLSGFSTTSAAFWLTTKSTSDLAEGSNLYFTNARAQNAISVSGLPLTYSGGVLGINQANGSQNGFLSSADWNTFNGKISSSSLSATYPLAYNSGTGNFTFLGVGTTSANSYNALQSFSNASSTNLSVFANAYFGGSATSSFNSAGQLSLAGLSNSLLSVNANGQVVATTSIGTNLLSGSIAVTNGGTGAASLTGILTGNGTNPVTGSSTLSVGYGGTGSTTLTGILLGNGTAPVNTLTIGSGLTLSGTTLSTSGAGITALGPTGETQSGGTQILATTTSAFNGLTAGITIQGAGNTQTFTPTLSGTLGNAGLTNSSLTVSAGSGLTGGGLISLGGSSALSLDLTSANNWTGLQTFANASTSLLSVFTQAYFGGSATSSFNSAGQLSLAGLSNSLLSVNANGQVIATTSIGTNLLTGTLGVGNGGTGSTTLSGLLKGNGTGSILTAVGGTDYEFPLTFSAPLSRSVNTISLNTDGTLKVTGGNLGIDLSHANSWTGLQSFTNASTSLLTLSGGSVFYTANTTSTIPDNTPYAWTIATSSTATPLFKIDTTAGSESVSLGGAGSNIIIGDTGSSPNILFQNNGAIEGLTGAQTITLGAGSDVINFTGATSTASNGFNISAGCFAIGGNCLSLGSFSGTLGIGNGGTGATSFGQGWIYSAGGTSALAASSSPTINYFTATSTTATSTIGTGGFVAGSNYLVVEQGTGNVGIGTASPTHTLEVSGTGKFSGTLALGTALSCTGSQALQTDGSGNISCGTIATGGASSGGGWIASGGANNGVITESTSTYLVAVGATSTPYAKFSILSGASGTTTLALVPAAAQTANIVDIYAPGGGLNSVFTAGGSFGLGTSSPVATFSTVGSGYFTGGLGVGILNTTAGTIQSSGAALIGGNLTVSGLQTTLNQASTTNITASGEGFFTTASTTNLNIGTPNALLSSNASGVVGATTFSGPLSFSGGILSLSQANASTNGFLSSSDWTNFNGKLASSSLSGASVISYTGSTGVITTAPGTFGGSGTYIFPNGTITNASSTIGAGTQANGLTIFGGATTTGNAYFANNVGIGTTSPGSLLSLNNIADFTTATSSFYSTGGINLAAGCFSVAGNCIVTGTNLLGANNTWTGTNTFNGNVTLTNATTSSFAISNLANTILSVNANGSVIATSTIGNNQLANSSITINTSGPLSGGGAVSLGGSLSLSCPTCTTGGITALGNYATTTGTAISFSTSTLSFQGLTLGEAISATPNALLFTPTVSGTLNNAGLTNSTIAFSSPNSTLNVPSTIALGAAAGAFDLNLSHSNWWQATQNFSDASTSQFTATSSVWFTGVTASRLLAVDNNGMLIATSSIGTNLLTGTLGVGNGGTGLASTPSFGQLLVGNGSGYTLTATSSLGLPQFSDLASQIGAAYEFPQAGNGTSTLTQFNGGLTAYASSTIGNGTQAHGLTISGGATTSGNQYIAGTLGIGTQPLTNAGLNIALNIAGGEGIQIQNTNSGGNSWISYVDDGGNGKGYVGYANSSSNFGPFAGNFNIIGKGDNIGLGYYDGGPTEVYREYINNTSGNIGIGTTTPNAKLSIFANVGETNSSLFNIASSTGNATTTLFSVSNTGTTTIANGVNITAGCFASGGSCLTLNSFSGTLGIANGGTNATSYTNGTLLSYNGTSFVSTSTIGNNQLQNSTIGATSPNSTLTFGAAASLGSTFTGDLNLTHSNWWQATQNFSNASTSQFTATSSVWFTALTNALLSTDVNGQVVATSTPTANNFNATLATATSTFNGGVTIGNASNNVQVFNNGLINFNPLSQNHDKLALFNGSSFLVASTTQGVNDSEGGDVGLGIGALAVNTGGADNLALGNNALTANTTGMGNIALGTDALESNQTGNNNIAIGYPTLTNSQNDHNNIAFAAQALQSLNGGSNNIALGNQALLNLQTGSENIAIGVNAATNLLGNQDFNLALGYHSLFNATTSNNNIAIGSNAMNGLGTGQQLTGAFNTAIGQSALLNYLTSSNNAALGYNALLNATSSNNNVAIGYQAGQTLAGGAGNNTFLGYNDDVTNAASSTLTNATAVGANILLTTSNTLILGNNENVGVGTSSPWAKFSIAGNSLGTTALFNISTSTATATTTVFNIDQNGNTTIGGNGSALSINGATTTAANGINLTTGCFAIGGNCLTLGSFSGTLGVSNGGTNATSFTSGQLLSYNGTSFVSTSTIGNNQLANAAIAFSNGGGLTVPGSPVALGGTATLSLDLTHANNWTGLQTFANASSTLFSVLSKAYFGGTATTTIDSAGNIAGAGTLSVNGLSTLTGGFLSQASSTVVGNFAAGTTTINGSISVNGATSTFADGINIGSGCIFYNGGCLGANAGSVNGGTQGQIPFYATTGSTLTATSSLFLSQAGYVGVGTNAPGFVSGANQYLTIASNGNGTLPALELAGNTNSNGGTTGRISFYNQSGGSEDAQISSTITNDTAKGTLIFSTANDAGPVEAMRIDPFGNVGIGGTSTPGSLLSIVGVGNFVANATSTLYNGLNVTSGCVSVNGTCLGTGNGTVTSITAGTGLTGGTITNSGTIALDLTHSNWWQATQNFTNATTSGFEATSTNVFLDSFKSALLSTNANGQLVATTSIGTNLLTGTLGIGQGGTNATSYTTGTLLSYNGTQFVSTSTISNNQLQNSAVTINTSGPLSGGGTVSLGGSLSLSCPTCTVGGNTYGWPWTIYTNYATTTNATSTVSQFWEGIFASSTSQFANSTTSLATIGTLYLTNALTLGQGGTGNTSFTGNGIIYSNGSILLATASSASSILTTNSFGVPSLSTTLPAFTLGGAVTGNGQNITGVNNFSAFASSTIGNGNQNGGLTVNGGATTTGNVYVSGKLGIGTIPSPSGPSPLAVVSNQVGGDGISIQNTNNGGNELIKYVDDGGNTRGYVGYMNSASNFDFQPALNIIGVNSNIGLGYYDGGSTEVYREFINNTFGTIGIGTTTPNNLLTLSTSTLPQLALNDGTAGNNAYTFRAVGGNLYIATSTFNATSSVSVLAINGITGALTINGATTTAANGINLTTGCFAIGGNCLTLGSFSGTLGIANGGTNATSFTNGLPIWYNGTSLVSSSTLGIGVGGTGATSYTQGTLLSYNGTSFVSTSTIGNNQLANSSLTVTANSPLTGGGAVSLGGSVSVGLQAASASQNGYLASTDYSLLHTATTTFSSPLSYSVSTNAVTCPTCTTGGITALGNYATTTGTAISFSTSTLSFQGLTLGEAISATPNALLFTPTVSGTLNNAGLTNSTIAFSSPNSTLNVPSTIALGAAAGAFDLNLSHSNWWQATQNFSNASTSQFTATSSVWFTGVTASRLLAVDNNGMLIATSSIGTNLLTGTLGVGNGGTGLASTPSFGQLLVGNGTGYTLTSTSSLGLPQFSDLASQVAAAYEFPQAGNGTSTLTQFNGGLTGYASSTIGNNTQAGGLTINGGATTTGNTYIQGTLGVGAQPLTNAGLNIALNSAGGFGEQIQNTNNAGSSFVDFVDDGSNTHGFVGYANTGSNFASLRGNMNIIGENTNIGFGNYNGGTAVYNMFINNLAATVGIGTTTPSDLLTLATSTGPQLSITDATSSFSAGNNAWTFRAAGNNFFLATSTFSATSTVSALAINGTTGAFTFNAGATSTFNNGLNVGALNITGTATSTAANGFNIAAGCFAVAGNCLSLGSFSGTLGVGNGGTGATTLTGILTGNGTSPVTGSSTLSVGYGGTGSTTLSGILLGNGTGALNTTILGGSLSLTGTTLQDAWTLAGSNLYNNAATNIGIDNTSPSYTLDVSGFINTDQFSGYKQAGNTVLYSTTTTHSLAVGASAAAAWMSASSSPNWTSVAIGSGALATTPVSGNAINNTAVGVNALGSNTTGANTTAIGYAALQLNTTGTQNTAIGYGALSHNTTTSFNTAIGYNSETSNSGASNLTIGHNTLDSATSSSANTIVGTFAGQHISGATGVTGGSDTLFGYQAGSDITTGSNNLILGYYAITGLGVTTGSDNILIGDGVSAGLNQTGSNQLNIGNLLFGTGVGTRTTMGTGNIGVGTSSPWAKFSIAGNSLGTTALFNISTSTATATTTVFNIDQNGNTTIGGNGSALSINGATTTAANGINLTTGCFAIGGNCLTLGSFSGTLGVSNGGTGNTSFTGNGIIYSNGSILLATASSASSILTTNSFGVPSLSTTLPAFTLGGAVTGNAQTLLGLGNFSAFASSTIGDSTQAGGLTINGGATTTGNQFILGAASTSNLTVSKTSILSGLVTISTGLIDNASSTFIGNNFQTGGFGSFGTTSPQFGQLTIGTSTVPQLLLTDNVAANNLWAFRTLAGNFYIATSTATATSTVSAFTINSSGFVGVATSSPGSIFSINNTANFVSGATATSTLYGFLNVSGANSTSTFAGGLSALDLNITGNSTSTFNKGINIAAGCFSIAGTCVGGSGGSGTVSSGTQGQFAFYAVGGTTVSGTSTFSINNNGTLNINTPALVGDTVALFNGTSFLVASSSQGSNDSEGGDIGIGVSALASNVSGAGNISIGNNTLTNNTTGSNNLAFGIDTMKANVGGFGNLALGTFALFSSQNDNQNIALGPQALQTLNGGNSNIALGDQTMENFTNGSSNIAIGLGAMLNQAGTNVNNNTVIGFNALNNATSTPIGPNTALGYFSMLGNNTGQITGGFNTAIGLQSLDNYITSSYNSVLGYDALLNATSSNDNVAIGYQAGQTLAGGAGNNTFLGYNDDVTNAASSTLTNATAVGANILLTTSNTLILGNSANIGIGTTTPGSLLSIAGIANFTTATSSFYSSGGINIAAGCFSVNGTCVGGSGGSGTVSSGTQGQFAFYNVNGTTVSGTSTLFASLSGNIGIGTTSPYSALTIWGQNASTNLFQAVSSASTTIFDINSTGIFNYGAQSTTTIVNNIPYSWTIATSTSAEPLFRIDTTSGSESVALGAPNSNIIIGDTNSSPNILFQNNGAIEGLTGAQTIILGAGSDVINFTGATSTASNGFNISAGCFAIGGTCIGGSGSGVTGGTAGMLAAFTSATALTATSGPTAASFYATSSIASQFPYASSTAISVSGTSFLTNLFATASSTIGGGTQTSGLTVYGGATTTLNAYFAANIGIATTSPWSDLSITNDVADPAIVVANSNNTATQFIVSATGLTGIGTSTPFWALTVASSSGPQIGLVDGNASDLAWTMRSVGNNFFLATSTATATSTNSSFAINGTTGSAYIEGTLGVGTQPVVGAGLNIALNNAGGEGIQIQNTNSGGNSWISYVDDGGNGKGFVGYANTSSNFGPFAGNFNIIGKGANIGLGYFDGGSTEVYREFINNTFGTIGIGTTTPSTLLTLATSTMPQLSLTDATSSFSSGNLAWTFRVASNNLFIATSTFGATSSVSALAINPNGLMTLQDGLFSLASSTIGGGTTASGLTIFGGATTTGNVLDQGNLTITGNLTLSTLGNPCNGGNGLQTNAVGLVVCGTIASGGNFTAGGWTASTTAAFGYVVEATSTYRIGIGATSSPYAELSIVGTGVNSSTTLALAPSSGQTADILDIYGTSGGLSSVFTSAGFLGIGSTTPDQSLTVNGNVNLAAGKCYMINDVCIGYITKLSTIYATSSVGTSTVNFTGAPNTAPLWTESSAVVQIQSNVSYYTIQAWGSGGGGGADTAATQAAGTNASTTCYSQSSSQGCSNDIHQLVQANGGTGGTSAGAGGAGGTLQTTYGLVNVAGTPGFNGNTDGFGAGGNAPMGGGTGGSAGTTAVTPAPNGGLYGGGGGGGRTTTAGGGGGGSGAYSENVATSSVTTTSMFSIGKIGTGAVAGVDAGGNGGPGGIVMTIYATSSPNAAGNDYAEMYPVSNPSINAGDIVAVDIGVPVSMNYAVAGSNLPLAGIVSTAPGQVLGDQTVAGDRPIALSGRVPTKVDLENGPISIGDRIAPSSVPGVGMKAGPFDNSVGIAMESYDGTASSSQITVFIDLQQGIDINQIAMQLLGPTNPIFTSIASSTSASSTSPLDFVGGMMSAIASRISAITFSAPASSTASTSSQPIATSTSPIDEYASGLLQSILTQITQWFANAGNGIGDFFANRVNTKQLCVSDDTGSSTCITKSQLDSLIAGAANATTPQAGTTSGGSSSGSSGSSSSSSSSDSSATTSNATSSPSQTNASSTNPIISINGNNPATVTVGATYTDLGATITGPLPDLNLGIVASVDGATSTAIADVTIDTSAPGTHTITYTATDQNGNVGTAERTVKVVAAPAPTPPASQSDNSATSTSSTPPSPPPTDQGSGNSASSTPPTDQETSSAATSTPPSDSDNSNETTSNASSTTP